MKRSGSVGLVLMGATAFVGTFAAGTAYFAWQKPSHVVGAAQVAQTCTQRPDGTQNCEPARRGFAYYLFPRSSWSWGWGNSYEPRRQEAALSNNSRSYAPTTSTVPAGVVVERSGFGSSAKGSFRVSAGG